MRKGNGSGEREGRKRERWEEKERERMKIFSFGFSKPEYILFVIFQNEVLFLRILSHIFDI